MRNYIFFLFIVFAFSMTSCRDDFNFEKSTGSLEFSKDTVYLDTVFTNIGSSTYRLKVYNRSNKDINIPTIKLAKSDSKYRMMIDGSQGIGGKTFNNVELLAKDSLFIFIETTIDYNEFAGPNAQFLYTDQIQFDAGSNLQTVELVTLVKDAYFIYPNRVNGVYEAVDFGQDETGATTQIRGRTLQENHPANGDEFIWNNSKPYVVYGYASVPAAKTLTVNAGARIHFHADSGIIVQNGGSLKINGSQSFTDDLENEVIMEGDRLESYFSDVPGQWGFIYLRQGSKEHSVTNLTLKNSTIGFLLFGNNGLTNSTADLTLKNVQIYNSANSGILSQGGYISGENVVINYAGASALYCNLGGKYNFKHATFNNNWSGTNKFALRIDNYINQGETTYPLIDTKFENCIIYSTSQNGLALDYFNDGQPFSPIFAKCVIKLGTSSNITDNPLYAFMADATNITRENPRFIDANKNNLMLGEDSSARNFGNNLGGQDINFNNRTTTPDVGAYNYIPE